MPSAGFARIAGSCSSGGLGRELDRLVVDLGDGEPAEQEVGLGVFHALDALQREHDVLRLDRRAVGEDAVAVEREGELGRLVVLLHDARPGTGVETSEPSKSTRVSYRAFAIMLPVGS